MTPSEVDAAAHQTLFDALTSMARHMVAIGSAQCPTLAERIDAELAHGACVRFQFDIGRAGPLGCSLAVVRLDGAAIEVVTLTAPAADRLFKLSALDSRG